MRPEARNLLKPLVALAVLALTLAMTLRALRNSGAWSHARRPAGPGQDPYSQLDRQLATWQALPPPQLGREPGGYAAAPPRVVRPTRTNAVVPVAQGPVPVLTAILWDADPTASIRIDGHDYTVRANSLFADYQVTSITRDQVVLTRAGESLVLRLQPKGERE